MPCEVSTFVEILRNPKSAQRAAALNDLFRAAEGGCTYTVAEACLDLLQKDELRLEEIAPHAGSILEYWNRVHAVAAPMQQHGPDTEWILEDEYTAPRAEAELLLDLLGYLPAEAVEPFLEEALRLPDPRLKCFAVTSLLRHGRVLDPDHIEYVAASHEMRLILMEQLQGMDLQWLMPERWSAPELLAASDLVRWAAHPNELGVPPEEIELMEIFQVGNEGENPENIYLFRFREYPRPWATGEGWMAGIAGPVKDGRSLGSPWSSFKRWDSMTPEEHFEKLYYRGSCC